MYFFNQIAEPRTYETRGNITIYSNPNGKEGAMHELATQCFKDGRPKWHRYNFNCYDRPGYTQEMFEEDCVGKTRAQIESTLLAIYTQSEGAFLTSNEIFKSHSEELDRLKDLIIDRQMYFFLDVGATKDQSCLIGGYPERNELNPKFVDLNITYIHPYPVKYPMYRVVGSESELKDSDGWHDEKSVNDILKEYTFTGFTPVFGCDVTGNSGLSPLFQALIHRIKHKQWEQEAAQLTATKSARGYWLINSGKAGTGAAAKAKQIPDDTQDATVGFIQLADNPVLITPGVSIL